MTFKKAYDGLSCADLVQRVALGGERPEIDPAWNAEFSALLCSCWDSDVKKRPEFNEVTRRLTVLLNAEQRSVEQSTKPRANARRIRK